MGWLRLSGVVAIAALLAGVSASAANAATPAGLRAQAARLSGAIEAQGVRLDQLAEAFDAAAIRVHELDAGLAADRRRLTTTEGKRAAARATLVQLAVASYVDGAAPVPLGVAGFGPSVAAGYASILAGTERRAVAQYTSLGQALTGQVTRLAAARRAAAAEEAAQRTAADQAGAAQAADRALLAQVTGRLAALVAADERARERDIAAAAAASTTTTTTSTTSTNAPTSATSTTVAPASAPTTAGPAPGTTTTTTTASASTVTTVPAPPIASPTTVALSTTTTTTPPPVALSAQAPGAATAIAYAQAQIGKPYQWGGAGPDSFDCSGLVMMAWAAAGVEFPHLAQDQYDLTERESLAEALPGDLIFFGTPDDVYHVGLYIGDGEMIDAPETGENVQIDPIYWPNLLGAGRVTASS